MVSTLLPAASFTLFQEAGKSNAHYSFVFAGAYEHDYTLDHLSPMDEVKTLILPSRAFRSYDCGADVCN